VADPASKTATETKQKNMFDDPKLEVRSLSESEGDPSHPGSDTAETDWRDSDSDGGGTDMEVAENPADAPNAILERAKDPPCFAQLMRGETHCRLATKEYGKIDTFCADNIMEALNWVCKHLPPHIEKQHNYIGKGLALADEIIINHVHSKLGSMLCIAAVHGHASVAEALVRDKRFYELNATVMQPIWRGRYGSLTNDIDRPTSLYDARKNALHIAIERRHYDVATILAKCENFNVNAIAQKSVQPGNDEPIIVDPLQMCTCACSVKRSFITDAKWSKARREFFSCLISHPKFNPVAASGSHLFTKHFVERVGTEAATAVMTSILRKQTEYEAEKRLTENVCKMFEGKPFLSGEYRGPIATEAAQNVKLATR